MRGLFVTGSDTGVGKTYCTAALARLLRRQGRLVQVCKPVATGATWGEGRWVSEDTRLLADAAGENDLSAVTPWTFPEPAAPPVAARLAGAKLTLDDLAGAARRRAPADGILLVEGVGGLLCPVTDAETIADLAARLNLPLVIVVRRGLGTLNHTLLTVEAARRRQLAVAGVVVSETAPMRGVAEETNVEELGRRLDVPLLAVLPHGGRADDLAGVDWWRLAGGA
jgi:dethiobiotin synthetase